MTYFSMLCGLEIVNEAIWYVFIGFSYSFEMFCKFESL